MKAVSLFDFVGDFGPLIRSKCLHCARSRPLTRVLHPDGEIYWKHGRESCESAHAWDLVYFLCLAAVAGDV